MSNSLQPVDYSPPGSSIHEILQARIPKPFPSPGNLPHPGIKPQSPALQADSLPSEPPGIPARLYHNPFYLRGEVILNTILFLKSDPKSKHRAAQVGTQGDWDDA